MHYDLILSCYLSDQMTEAQWQEHLNDPSFKSWYDQLKEE